MISINKINYVIQLAEIRRKFYDVNPDADYNDLDRAIENYLKSLTFDEIKSLQSIMYLGRDKDYDRNQLPQQIYNSQYDYFDKTLGWNTKELEIDQMVGKLPLDLYLTSAKTILEL